MRRIVMVVAALALVFAGVPPAVVTADDSGGPAAQINLGFTPNSGEASVSRVDLVSMTEIARHYTAPRLGDEVDLVGDPTPGTANSVAPRDWRTSRIALDSGSNAWMLNVGADGTDLRGSVVRVQADTTGLTTHEYTSQSPKEPDPLPFGTDEAVQVFPVGDAGDMPRAIAIDSDGYIWVGFYSGAQLMKYEYDVVAGTLTPVDGPFFPDVSPDNNVIRYYDMQFAPDGMLFISSRGSTPTRTPRQEGIWTFNPATEVFTRDTTWNPYALLMAEDGTVYATAYNNLLYIRDKDTGVWSPVTITGSTQNRGMEFDDHGRIWIASTTGPVGGLFGGTVIYSYNIATDTPGPTYTMTSGTTPVGMGRDATGKMWAICRSDGMAQGWLEAFDPSSLAKAGAIEVGFRPYCYRDFVVSMVPASLGDFVWNDENRDGIQDEDEPGIEGVTVKLLACDTGAVLATTTTDADGYYLFMNLMPGNYQVQFILPDGNWVFTQQFAGDDPEVDSNADPATGLGDCITLAEGETNLTIDAGMYQLFEELTVKKTVNTSYTRTHLWDIDKYVETRFGYTIGEERTPKIWLWLDGSGDECAKWTVDVTYKDYVDSNHKVSGTVTITNTGDLDALIEGVDDLLGGTSIAVDFGVTLPYTLEPGLSLEGTYSEDGEFTGENVVTVTTERDTYGATEPILWGDPGEQINKTVNIKDLSDQYGEAHLGSVTAPDGGQFTYEHCFAWTPDGGSLVINNTATIVETEQSAQATLEVNWETPPTACPLTPGYWKTHSRYGPAPYDDTWALIGEDTAFFLSRQSHYRVLWTPPAGGNAYYILAHAYIAAELNSLNGAFVPDDVRAAFDRATSLFERYTPAEVRAWRGNRGDRPLFVSLAELLDDYNNGLLSECGVHS